jgi:hypothetical protein
MNNVTNTILFVLAIIFAVWFILVGMIWFYMWALVFAYPVGLLSLGIWLYIRRDGKKRNKTIPIMLLVGLAASIVAFVLLFFWN